LKFHIDFSNFYFFFFPEDGEAIAHFLRTTPTLSKKQIGIYIAIPANQHVLTAFISTFHFAKKRIDEALR